MALRSPAGHGLSRGIIAALSTVVRFLVKLVCCPLLGVLRGLELGTLFLSKTTMVWAHVDADCRVVHTAGTRGDAGRVQGDARSAWLRGRSWC